MLVHWKELPKSSPQEDHTTAVCLLEKVAPRVGTIEAIKLKTSKLAVARMANIESKRR